MITMMTLLLALALPTHEQTPTSPCPHVFSYEPSGETGRWDGVITLSTDTPLVSLWLKIVLDCTADRLGNWVGEVSTTDNTEFEIQNTDIHINPGPGLAVRFFVHYNPLNKTPRLKAIRFNGRPICDTNISQPSNNISETNLNVLGTIPITSRPISSSDDDDTQSSDYFPDGQISFTLPSSSATNSDKEPVEPTCGKVTLESSHPLVLSGVSTSEGQWPWQIALYQIKTIDNKYICGGTLVSHRHVITAAHCVTRHQTHRVVNKNTLTVYLGKHSLRTSVTGVQIQFVETITVHPEYNATIFSRDLAILTLRNPVTYTDWVRSACLWPDNLQDLSYVVGRKGSVVGWGYDDTGKLTEELNLVQMPVVSQLTCIRSSSAFFDRFTSDYTYCAGYRNGSSVCNGDSGGSMVFKLGRNWYVRGVVSLSKTRPNENHCDPSHYVIFTDLAQYLPWIRQQLSDY